MKRYIAIGVIIIVIFGGYFGVNAFFSVSQEIPTTIVKKGEFVIPLVANGSVDAKRAYTITAPRMRGLQITWLAPEGSMVAKGDTVVKFDATEQLADIAENESSLKIARQTLERAKKEYEIQGKQLDLDLKKAQRNYDEKKYEAAKIAEEARIELELAELNIKAKMDQYKADVSKSELEVQRAEDKVDQAKKEYEQTIIKTPLPGMVVYLEIWKGSSMDKVQEGDSPWPGQGLIKIPDLSEMVVDATVSEVDASVVDSGQAVIVTLDAQPDKEYHGTVTSKSTLARRKESGSKINVFDVTVAINDHDESVKPGMSASCKIIIDKLPDVVYTPLESVFEKDGKAVVYLDNEKMVPVEVGRRNDMSIQILSGLKGGEKVCLVDPTLDETGLPGEKASEPELNKGRQLPPSNGSPRRGRR